MKVNRSKTVSVLVFLLAFVLLSNVFCVSLLSDHDCKGEDCFVCFFIGLCESFRRLLCVSMICFVAAVALLCLRTSRFLATAKEVFSSPVIKKVKLSF